ncbi:hypothetical protein [Geoalkalibacter subterraneus]|uniref:Lipoprotein n=1 Tax=Geoalkalibacter subterraneus TaxID=483547 RepID=A0A0B5FNG6_9BACT|nr:hypothetical protein [Geoalkalibacter subterraneus]AJF05520.1 hypothetical protein GSUB_01530 [Geoalkalibacter subterraneus]
MIVRLLALLSTLCLAACAAESTTVEKKAGFVLRPDTQVIYIAPFRTVMVPAPVADPLFDTFVDELNLRGEQSPENSYSFVILKKIPAEIDGGQLARHHYLTGELYGFLEDSGGGSTTIQIQARLQLFQPGNEDSTLTIHDSDLLYFDHDQAALPEKRQEIAQRVAHRLADSLWQALMDR